MTKKSDTELYMSQEKSKSKSESSSLSASSPHKSAPKGYPKERTSYADPEGFKYPLETEEHVRAAISYFSKPENAGKYPAAKQHEMWSRIKTAAKKFGITISPESGPPSVSGMKKSKELEMNDLFKSILAHDISGDLVKGENEGPMNDEPRAQIKSRITKASGSGDIGEDFKEVVGNHADAEENETSIAMVDHPRPGSTDMNAWYEGNQAINTPGLMGKSSVPMVQHERPVSGMGKSGDSSGEHGSIENSAMIGEAGSTSDMDGTSGIPGADFSVPDMSNHPVGGMPSVEGEYKTISLGEDDIDSPAHLRSTDESIRSTLRAGEGGGSFDGFGFDFEQGVANGGGESSEAMFDHPRPGPGLTKSDRPHQFGAHTRAIQIAGKYVSNDVQHGVGVARGQMTSPVAPLGQTWRVGNVQYSTGEDERIAKAMEQEGGVRGEPTLSWQSQLIKSRVCAACRQSVPVFLTTCPACGAGSAYANLNGGVNLSKAVQDSLRGNQVSDLKFADGTILLKSEDQE